MQWMKQYLTSPIPDDQPTVTAGSAVDWKVMYRQHFSRPSLPRIVSATHLMTLYRQHLSTHWVAEGMSQPTEDLPSRVGKAEPNPYAQIDTRPEPSAADLALHRAVAVMRKLS